MLDLWVVVLPVVGVLLLVVIVLVALVLVMGGALDLLWEAGRFPQTVAGMCLLLLALIVWGVGGILLVGRVFFLLLLV